MTQFTKNITLNSSTTATALPPVGTDARTYIDAAIASGYLAGQLVLNDDFTTNTTTNGTAPIKNWFNPSPIFGQVNYEVLASTAIGGATQNGVLHILTANTGNTDGLISATTGYATSRVGNIQPNTGAGAVYRYGYFEASIYADTSQSFSGVPGFWMTHVQDSNFTPPTGASGANTGDYGEVDFVEVNSSWTASGRSSCGMIDWLNYAERSSTGHLAFGNNPADWTTAPANLDFTKYNTFGGLWTSHAMTFFWNNHFVFNIPIVTNGALVSDPGFFLNLSFGNAGSGNHTYPGSTDSASVPGSTTTQIPGSDMYLVLGAGSNWPVFFDWVHVWQ